MNQAHSVRCSHCPHPPLSPCTSACDATENTKQRIWTCKVGGMVKDLPEAADAPMREALTRTFREVTGAEVTFIFSGWGAQLTEHEQAVVDCRESTH